MFSILLNFLSVLTISNPDCSRGANPDDVSSASVYLTKLREINTLRDEFPNKLIGLEYFTNHEIVDQIKKCLNVQKSLDFDNIDEVHSSFVENIRILDEMIAESKKLDVINQK